MPPLNAVFGSEAALDEMVRDTQNMADGMDTSSPVADDYFDKAPFKFDGTLKRLHFKYLPVEKAAFVGSPDDD